MVVPADAGRHRPADRQEPAVGTSVRRGRPRAGRFSALTLPKEYRPANPAAQGHHRRQDRQNGACGLRQRHREATPPAVEGMSIELTAPWNRAHEPPGGCRHGVLLPQDSILPRHHDPRKNGPRSPRPPRRRAADHPHGPRRHHRPFAATAPRLRRPRRCHRGAVRRHHRPGRGPPGKATLNIPIGVTDVRVPFEFKDVIIP